MSDHEAIPNDLAIQCSCGDWSMLYRNYRGADAAAEHVRHVEKATLRAEVAALRQQLDEARRQRDTAINDYDKRILEAGRSRPREADGGCGECGAAEGHEWRCRELAVGLLVDARDRARADAAELAADRDRLAKSLDDATAHLDEETALRREAEADRDWLAEQLDGARRQRDELDAIEKTPAEETR